MDQSKELKSIELKGNLESKLDDALFELKYRLGLKKSTLAEIQRMYGYCLGMRSSLMELNKTLGCNQWDFKGELIIQELLKSELGSLSKKGLSEFKWPVI